ncbi:uncharacterized protein TRIADDRAFT_61491 [Trichoplax adhaerens]|uniref:Uncharacterized protein n=1 Tax=Trichoplax adhaerens TaxID=10228 RepID=B3SB50_TRIAD|nr:hypothetical protein TRIADDRAFT_61491 [Trichoplax adhaerens]EDV20102.1 hypothetical protein TRIADDRAFT_61491 [Trichoplax adhaerens]|eukprot:XP_002117486.1 hypothetical protein TRIADDRAFT_61491 [Trichoplax adhaerens]
MDQAYCSQESLNAVMVEDYLALYNDSPVIVFYPLVDRFHFDQDDNQVIVQPLANSYAHVVPYQRPYCGSNGELNCLVDIQRAIMHWFLEKKSKYLILQRDRALLGCKVLFYLSEIRQWREGVIQDFSGNHCSIFDRMTLQSKLLDPRITDIRPMISDEILAELSDESTCFRHGRLNRLFSLSNIKLYQCINGSNFNPTMVTQSESRQNGIFPNSNYDDMHSNNNHLELEIPTSKAMATPTTTLSSSPTNNLLNSVSCNDQDHSFLLTKKNQLDPITPSNWNDALRLLQPRRKRRRKFDCETKSSKNTDAVDINPIQSEKIVQMTNLPPENKNSSEDSKMAASKDSNDNLSPANVEKSDNDPVHAEDLPIPNVNTKATLHAHTYNSQESQKNLPDEARRNSSGDCKTAALEDINENFPPPDVEKSGNDPAKAEDLSAVNVNTKATLSDYAYNAQESPIDLPHETREIDKFQFELNCLEYQSKKKKKKIMNLKSDNFRNQDLTSIRSSSSSKQLTSLPIGPQALPVTKHQAKAAPKSLTETLAMRTTLPVTDSWSKPEADSLPKSCLNVSKAIQAESWAEVSTSALSPIPPNHSGKQDFNNGVKSTDSVKKRKTMPKSLPKDGSLTPQPCSCNQLVKYLPRCLDCGSFQDDNSDIEDNCCRFLNFRLLSFAGKWNAREFCLDKNSTISNIWLPGKNGNPVINLYFESG